MVSQIKWRPDPPPIENQLTVGRDGGHQDGKKDWESEHLHDSIGLLTSARSEGPLSCETDAWSNY